MRTAGSNRLRGELAGNELRTRKEYVSDRDAGFKQPLERCKLLTRWAFEYFDQTSIPPGCGDDVNPCSLKEALLMTILHPTFPTSLATMTPT